MFGKKKSIKSDNKNFIIVRSYYGLANHIAKNDGSLPLCGYENGISTDRTMSKIDIIDAIPNQHDGWFYCAQCAEKATGFDADTIASYRH